MASDGSTMPTPEDTAQVLRRRAEALARPPLAETSPGEGRIEILVVEVADERYGLEARHVREVAAVGHLTRVPGVPPALLGVVNHRGRILPLFDVRRLLDLPSDARPPVAFVAVEVAAKRFGLAINAVTGIAALAASELFGPSPAAPGGRRAVRAVTRDMVGVIDLDALVAEARFTVNDDAA